MAHAYFIAGDPEFGLSRARSFAETVLEKSAAGNPDIIVLQHSLFTVDDARRLIETAQTAPANGVQKFILVSATRIFHEAQNALLKLFEEPPQGVTLVLVIPAEGILLPTLRSRLTELPDDSGSATATSASAPSRNEFVETFLTTSNTEREKLIAKLIDRTKSDKDEEKQAARNEVVVLLEEIVRIYTPKFRSAKNSDERQALSAFLADVNHFLPILHTRAAPLKLILEHIRLTWPRSPEGKLL